MLAFLLGKIPKENYLSYFRVLVPELMVNSNEYWPGSIILDFSLNDLDAEILCKIPYLLIRNNYYNIK